MIVVSDTSPLNYLVLINAINVLPKLFNEIHVPPVVIQELQHQRTPESVRHWTQNLPDWLHVTSPSSNLPAALLLDPGEAQALALANELHAQALLIDEKKGRRIAKEHGFVTLGTITILELAAREGHLDLPTAFNLLQHTSFQISQDYITAALQRDAARKRN